MSIEGWKYYNHAAVPTTAPHEKINFSALKSGEIWSIEGKHPLLIRWVTDFDCNHETSWWYVIKDNPTTLEQCKKKVRKEIRKADKNFEIKVIDPFEYEEDIKRVYHAAVAGYEKPDVPLFLKQLKKQEDEEWIGAFERETGQLVAYKVGKLHKDFVEMITAKVNPEYSACSPMLALNFYQIERYINSGLYRYMSNGARTVLHQTGYNDYLEQKLGFRKAYCKLNIKFRPEIKIAVKGLYPFRKVLKKMDRFSFIRQVNGILEMESILRNFDSKEE